MKIQLMAGLLSAALATAAAAEEQSAKPVSTATAATATATVAGEGEIQHRTYHAGNQLLIDISAKVGSDLDDRLQREFGEDVTIGLPQGELLVSSNLQ